MAANESFYAGKLKQNGAVLAPMAGYSDAPMRQLASENGALWTVSEMISARGIVLGGESEKLNLGRPYAGETSRVVQLFGAEPAILAEAVRKVEAWFSPAAIDLNMGCPVPKIKGKGGSCLLQTPELAFELIQAMRSATTLDISAKIRLGWDTDRSLEIARGLSDAGASIITIHGRTSAQRYTGEADWEAIAKVASSISTPVIGSGDILSASQARERLSLGVAGVMIGRGAVGNPWIFNEVAGKITNASLSLRAATALRHAQLQSFFYSSPDRRNPEKMHLASMKPLRKVLPKYLPDAPQARAALIQVETLEDVRLCLEPLINL